MLRWWTVNQEATMATLDELKKKYQSVLDIGQREQVSLQNLHVQDGKLFIKGTAPSLQAANKIWDEIKRINPQANDITADFPVDNSRPVDTGRQQARPNV